MGRSTRGAIAAIGALLAMPGAAQASPGSPTSATVTLGDSFISGEAGRWQGNSNATFGSRDGTDRAWVRTWYGGYYDADRVYIGGSDSNGCHRSDVAEVFSATITVHEEVNLACSGARAENVIRAASGGQSRNEEPPQADQLLTVARQRDVRVVALSIGGNDLGFGNIIAACASAWTASTSRAPEYCYDDQQPLVSQCMPRAMADVGRVIDDVRAVMKQAGYSTSQFRFVLQSYPSPLPRGSANRYPETGLSRLNTGGCPFWNRDLDWARGDLVDQIADNLRTVAAAKGLQFLDLRDLLEGREACARSATLVTDSTPPSETRSEWSRFLTSGIGQGERQESFHPNAYAQRSLGRCLTLIARQSGSAYACRSTLGQGVSSTTLAPIATASTARAHRGFRRFQRAARHRRPFRGAWPPRYPSRAAVPAAKR